MLHADDFLIDDGAGVEVGGDIVAGGADELHAALVGALVGIRADERGRKEWWILMIRPCQRAQSSAGTICM